MTDHDQTLAALMMTMAQMYVTKEQAHDGCVPWKPGRTVAAASKSAAKAANDAIEAMCK